LSAYGAAASELRVTVARDLPPAPLTDQVSAVHALLRELDDTARQQMGAAFDPGEGATRLAVRPSLGLRYVRQLNLIEVPLDAAALDAAAVPALLDEFRRRYERVVGEGTSNDETPIEIVRVAVSIASTPPDVVPTAPPVTSGATVR